MSFPLFSAIREGLENVKNSLDAIQTAVNGQVNTINVSGGGSTQWAGTVDLNETIIIAQGLDFIRGDLIYYKSSDTSHSFQALSLGRGDSQIDGNISTRLLANGDFTIEATFEQLEVVISFTSYPLMTGGVIGPRGVDGTDGADGADGLGWGSWSNLTLNSNVSNANVSRPSRYRISAYDVQLEILVEPDTSWSGDKILATIEAAARPTRTIAVAFVSSDTDTNYLGSIKTNGEITALSAPISNGTTIRLLTIYPIT